MDDALTYLRDRFRNDADALRRRAVSLAGQPAPPHGPDAAASKAMAAACDAVVAMVDRVTSEQDFAKLGPALKHFAEREHDAHVRSVYAGAAVRVDEVRARRERRVAGDDGDDSSDDSGDDSGDDSSDAS